MDILKIKEKFPNFVCEDAKGETVLDVDTILGTVEDLNDHINEQDYQIQYILKEIDKLKRRTK